MIRKASVAIALGIILSGCATTSGGGNTFGAASNGTSAEAEIVDLTQFVLPRDERATLIVMDFDYSAVSSNLTSDEGEGLAALVSALRGDSGEREQSRANLGAGIANLSVEKLLESGQFRILERQMLDRVLGEQDLASSGRAAADQSEMARQAQLLGAQYMLVGSITRLGSEETTRGVALGGRFARGLGAVGARSRTTQVVLNARLVDTSTGEVLLSANGEGISNRGGGLALGGAGALGGIALGSSTSNVRETAVGEATDAAVHDLIANLAHTWSVVR
jgi:curli biogenesis system outer membrane secretion channel CsgG